MSVSYKILRLNNGFKNVIKLGQHVTKVTFVFILLYCNFVFSYDRE